MRSRHVLVAFVLGLAWASGCGSDDASSSSGGGGGAGVGGAGGSSGSGSSGAAGASGGSGGGSGGAASDASACTLTKPYSSQNAGCNACAEQQCCALINACYADSDCDDGYVNCILACALLPGDAGDAGVESCLADCATAHPTGKAEYDAAIGCADGKCAAACN